MKTIVLGMIVGTAVALAAAQAWAVEGTGTQTAAVTQGADGWRYQCYEGRWWYWTPANNWVYWQNDRWNDFVPGAVRYSVGYRGEVEPAATAQPAYTVQPGYFGPAQIGVSRSSGSGWVGTSFGTHGGAISFGF
jgi:hypothetical protein